MEIYAKLTVNFSSDMIAITEYLSLTNT